MSSIPRLTGNLLVSFHTWCIVCNKQTNEARNCRAIKLFSSCSFDKSRCVSLICWSNTLSKLIVVLLPSGIMNMSCMIESEFLKEQHFVRICHQYWWQFQSHKMSLFEYLDTGTAYTSLCVDEQYYSKC